MALVMLPASATTKGADQTAVHGMVALRIARIDWTMHIRVVAAFMFER
jgi:hypothetical protein